MPNEIVITIFIFLCGIVFALIGFIMKALNNRIDQIKTAQDKLPINKLFSTMSSMKTDIAWIKERLEKANL